MKRFTVILALVNFCISSPKHVSKCKISFSTRQKVARTAAKPLYDAFYTLFQTISPQVKQDLIPCIINFVQELPLELSKDLESQETRKYHENLKVGCRQSLVPGLPFKNIRLWSWQLKITEKQVSKFFGLFRFYLISLLCSIKFFWDLM